MNTHRLFPGGPSPRRGMTLVEAVCALAVMALAAAAALGALGVAARGSQAARQAMRETRAETGLARMLREDLWGLALLNAGSAGDFEGRQPGSAESGVFLEFDTLRTLEARGWQGPRGLRRVEYSLRLAPDGWEIWRAEAVREPGRTPDRAAFWEERAARGTWAARMGFHDGKAWLGEWSLAGAPKAVRLSLVSFDLAVGAETEQTFVFEVWAGGGEQAAP